MKRSLPIFMCLLLCHCGTEVGNGITTKDDSGGAKSGSTTGSGTTNDTASPENSQTPTSAPYTPFSTYFLTACASPFAEAISGTFANAQGVPIFTVGLSTASKVTVTANSILVYTITPAPSVSPYAIEALSVSPAVTCGTINTETLADSSIQRSATLTDGTIVRWILKAGTVSSMKVVYSNMSEEIWIKSGS